jgi:ribosome-associated protein
MSAPVEVAPGVPVPAAALRFTYTTSRGPGGQNVNRRATRAELRVAVDDLGLSQRARTRLEKLAGSRLTDAGELLIGSDEKRSQRQNREICLQRLRDLIVRARALPKPRKPTRPSRGAIERRIKEKKQRGEAKRRRKPPEGGS